MKQRTLTILLLSLSALLFSGAASAQTARGPFGVGAEVTTTGLVGAMFVYDPGPFHLDALLNANFAHDDQRIGVAGRFFFPLHRSERADFSVGPGIGIVHSNRGPGPAPNDPDRTDTEFHLEGAVQIRAFVVSNVALSASAGFGAVFKSGENNNSATIGGQTGAVFGIAYFF